MKQTPYLKPLVSIVILNYNGKKYLEKFLPSVVCSTYSNKKIIVADNCSTDDSIEFIKANYPQVELLINTVNLGFAGGYNWALKRIESDYYVLLNSDVEVEPNWIEPAISLLETDSNIAAVQSKILSYHQKDTFEYAGACGGWIDRYGYPFSRGRVFDFCEKDEHQHDEVQQVFWVTGASMFIRANVFHKMNGFDESFFAHMEEIDLCWRMQLAGYKLYVEPKSVVYHVGGGTLPNSPGKLYLNHRNNVIMMVKNLSFKEKIWKVPIRFALNNVAAVRELSLGNFGNFKAIIRAELHVLDWIFFRKHPINKHGLPRLPMRKMKGFYNGSIVWDYFIEKKRLFKEIVK